MSRKQGIGAVALVAGLALARAAGSLRGDDVALAIGAGRGAPRITLDPPSAVLGIGLAVALAGAVALAEPWTRRWAGLALILATVLLVPLVLVGGLALSPAQQTNVVPLLAESLSLGTPVALGALSGLWCERAGVVNLGIEGMMLAGAGIGFVAYALLGASGGLPLVTGVVAAVAAGGLLGVLHAVLCVTFRVDQIVSGVAINLLAFGVTGFLRAQVLLPLGISSAGTLPEFRIPLLSDIPLVGRSLFAGKPIFFAMFGLFALTQLVLLRTPWGLRVRSVGENPHAAATLGVDVVRTRCQAVILGGLLAGLAGAWLSLESVGSFSPGMSNGRGFIALAALIFGKWRPWPAFGGAMLFGFTEALGTRLQFLGVQVAGHPVPSQFLQILPFLVTIVVLAGAIGRAIPPAADGIPYQPSR
ncbi:MAG: ABC transporter permease [Egibacteraceae bacterium]